jgi:magnesium transporter
MLSFHSSAAKGAVSVATDAKTIPPEVNWIDAMRPDAQEIAFLERALGIEVPTFAALSEIESSRRLRSENDWLYISIPMIYQPEGFIPGLTPLGFVLSKDLLLTVRFKPMKAFDDCKDNLAKQPLQPGGPGVLINLVELIVDHAADILEGIAGDLDHLSELIFGASKASARHGPREDSDRLRTLMQKIGRNGDLTSKIEDLLLGVARMLPFVATNAAAYLEADIRAKLKSLQRDVASLNDYETNLTGKSHFLLDATLGLTNIEQNNIFRILTVVSVVGIPPTFFASMWGMNFKNMPELEWTYGYEFSLCVIAMSALIPFIWFKWRGWW